MSDGAASLSEAKVLQVQALPIRRQRKVGPAVGITVFLGLFALVWISPLILLVTTAVRPLSDFIANGPLAWPSEFTGKNFADAWRVGNFTATYRNSAIVALIKVPLGVIMSALLAYPLAKLHMPGRRIVMFTVFLGLTVPIYIAILPNFVMVRQMGLTDNLLGLIGPYLAFGIPFEVLVLQAFFRSVPDEIFESARVDGAGAFRTFWQILLPLSTPALVTVGILDGVATWNEFLMALIILNSDQNKTIPVGLLNFQGQFANNNTGQAAGIIIAVLPILLAYIILQKWIVGGLTAGATKG